MAPSLSLTSLSLSFPQFRSYNPNPKLRSHGGEVAGRPQTCPQTLTLSSGRSSPPPEITGSSPSSAPAARSSSAASPFALPPTSTAPSPPPRLPRRPPPLPRRRCSLLRQNPNPSFLRPQPLQSDSGKLPSGLKQLSKITTSLAAVSEVLTSGIAKQTSFFDRLVDKLASPDSSGFVSVILGTFARNLVVAAMTGYGLQSV